MMRKGGLAFTKGRGTLLFWLGTYGDSDAKRIKVTNLVVE
jgi:hypothetical protein